MNFRSRGELIDAVALAFERLWGDDYEPLREAPGAREPALRDPVVDLLVVDLEKRRWDAALPPEEGALGAGMAGVTPVARARGAAAGPPDRRAHARRALRLPRRGGAAARHHEHGRLRARARGARHPHPRGRRSRVLEPAAGERPAPLARRARQPARRAGAVLGARLAAGRAVARLRHAAGAARPRGPQGSRCGRCARRSGTPATGSPRRCRRRTWPGRAPSSSASTPSAPRRRGWRSRR